MEWIKRWAGSYTFVSCAYWAKQYDDTLKEILGVSFPSTVFIHRKGTVSFFVKKEELDNLGNYLANKVKENKNFAFDMLQKLKDNTDLIMFLMNNFEGKILSYEDYKIFHTVFERHLAYHVFMKKTVDYLETDLLDELLHEFRSARIYSEPVYSKTEQFFRSIAKTIAEKEEYDPKILTCLLQGEFEKYLLEGNLPDKKLLKDRYESSAIFFSDGKLRVDLSEDVAKLEGSITKNIGNIDSVKGISAHTGKVKGRCKIVLDPFSVNDFKDGDVLITGMTRPEFIPYIKKASAIVTDVGGILCHAAIISREIKKPCIVGTKNATKLFKDGDYIEVDAEKGIIKKIKTKHI